MRTGLRILGIILIFVFGVFVGAAATGAGIMKKAREALMGGPESIMDIVVKRLDSELKLDPEQKRKLQSIVDDAHIKLRQSHAKIQPEIEATLSEAEQRVRAMLYPNQIKQFDRLVDRSREKWKPAEKYPAQEIPKETPKPADIPPPPHHGD